MRVLTNKDGDLLSIFDKANKTEARIRASLLEQIPISNQGVGTNKERCKVKHQWNIFLEIKILPNI